MVSKVSRRVIFIKGKKKPPKQNWMKQAQGSAQAQRKDNPESVFGGGAYRRELRKPSLFKRILGWTASLALVAVAATGMVWFYEAVMAKLDVQPTIAETIARSKLNRGQSAGGTASYSSSGGERSHAASNEESFLATYAHHKGSEQKASAAEGGLKAGSTGTKPEPTIDDCTTSAQTPGSRGNEIANCLQKLGAPGDNKH